MISGIGIGLGFQQQRGGSVSPPLWTPAQLTGATNYYNAAQTDSSGFDQLPGYGAVAQIPDLIGEVDALISPASKVFFSAGTDKYFKFIQYNDGYHKSSVADFYPIPSGNNFTVFAVLKIPVIETGNYSVLQFYCANDSLFLNVNNFEAYFTGLNFAINSFDLSGYMGILFTAHETSVIVKGNVINVPQFRLKLPNYDETNPGTTSANLDRINIATRLSGGNSNPLTTDEVNLKELVISENPISVEDLANLEAYCAAKGYAF